MTVGSEFPGDNNDTLMDVQHAAYGEMVVRLFTGPRDRYLAAAAQLRVDDKLSGPLRSMDGFDHRTLQLAHDRIAAFFVLPMMMAGNFSSAKLTPTIGNDRRIPGARLSSRRWNGSRQTTSLRGPSAPLLPSGTRSPESRLSTGSTSF
jgi:hypothetical protein